MEQIVPTPQLTLPEAINAATSKIFQFTGRSRRSEYWWTMLIVFAINIVLTPMAGFVAELLTIPLTFRRLHDVGKSGWWYGGCLILKALFLISFLYDALKAMFLFFEPIDYMGYPAGPGPEFTSPFFFLAKYMTWIGIITLYHVGLLFLLCKDSDEEENEYGESPKYTVIDDEA